jgi:hypothetical protein
MNHPTEPSSPRVLIGTHTYAGAPAAMRRQQEAIEALAALRGAECVNVQFAQQPHDVPELRTLPLLKLSSNTVSGRRGPSKAIVPEVFDVLAAEASARSIDYICFTNSDIIVSQEAVDRLLDDGREAYVFSREEFDSETRATLQMTIAGVDALAVSTVWWLANRRRFRRYIVGEVGWDNVFTAIVMCHADARIENRHPFVRHERHPMGPLPSPHFGQYVRMLTAFDAGYFSLWCRYWDGLSRLRAAGGATPEQEADLARDVFVWNPGPRARAVQWGRDVKATVRYAWWKLRAGPG